MMSAGMKMLKNLLFVSILMVGCSLAAFGQNGETRNIAPKEGNKPKIKVVPKNDKDKNDNPKDAPKNDSNEPKKPEDEV